MAAPVAEFVAGVMDGIDFRNRLKDRKLDRARQEKMDELVFAREARAAEEHALRMREARREMGLRDAAMADQQAAYAATQADMAAPPPDVTTGTAGAPPAGAPQTPEARGVAQVLGLPVPGVADPAQAGQRGMALDRALPQQAAPAAGAIPGPTQAAAARIARPAQFEPGPAQQPPSFNEWYAMSRKQREAMGLPVSEAGMRLAMVGDPPETASRRTLREAQEASKTRAFENLDPGKMVAAGLAKSGPPGLAGQARAELGIVDPAMLETAPITTEISKPPVPGPTVQAAAERGIAAVQEAAPPAAKDAAQAGAARATEGMGLTPDKPITKAQRSRGERAFIDRYMEVGMPMVIEGYLKRGDIEGAMRYQEFLDTYSTKQAMKTYASAMFDASVGNFDGFVDGMMDLYNNESYFPDGMTVDKAKSRIVKGEDGNPTGALLVLTDKDGNEFEQIIQADDMIAWGATMLAPENAVTYWADAAKAKMEREKGIADEQVNAAKEAREGNEAVANLALKMLEEDGKRLDRSEGAAHLTWEQAMEKARQALSVGSVARPGDVPAPLYRP